MLAAAAASQNPENALIFRLMAATGCRLGELCGLRWSDVALDNGTVVFRQSIAQVGRHLTVKDTKAHQQRTVALDAGTREAMQRHHEAMQHRASIARVKLPRAGRVFADAPDGSAPIPPDRLTQAWTRSAESVGVDSRLHDLRHFQASLLLDAGESVTTVAARLGHRNTATTLRVYSHLMPGADRRAAAAVGDVLDA